MTQTQADRIHARTERIVSAMRTDADTAEARGDLKGATALRTLADSRERAGQRARVGAKITNA